MRGPLGLGLWCLWWCLSTPGCGSQNDGVAAARASLRVPDHVPVLDFDVDAEDGSTIALTFDDGPDEAGTTAAVLDVLRAEGARATFFVNTRNAVDVLTSSSARTLLQRIVAEGHELGNHGVHHHSLGAASTDVSGELAGVVDVLRAVAPDALATRLVRAPFGEPYFGPQATLDRVAPVVARYGVHVGWNIDSLDWSCEARRDPVSCILGNVLGAIDEGRSGLVLLHSTTRATVEALPQLISELRRRGKRFVGVEELVVAKYGRPSRALFHCERSAECFPGDVCGASRRCAPAADDDEPIVPAQSSADARFIGTGCAVGAARGESALLLAVVTAFVALRARSPRRAGRR